MEIVLAKLEIVLTITAMRGNSCGDYGNIKDKQCMNKTSILSNFYQLNVKTKCSVLVLEGQVLKLGKIEVLMLATQHQMLEHCSSLIMINGCVYVQLFYFLCTKIPLRFDSSNRLGLNIVALTKSNAIYQITSEEYLRNRILYMNDQVRETVISS